MGRCSSRARRAGWRIAGRDGEGQPAEVGIREAAQMAQVLAQTRRMALPSRLTDGNARRRPAAAASNERVRTTRELTRHFGEQAVVAIGGPRRRRRSARSARQPCSGR